jgi:hypothetical protein
MLIRVDLPAPLGPTIEANSPASTPRLTPSGAQNSPALPEPSAWRITRDPSGRRRDEAHEAIRCCDHDHGEHAPKISRQ